MKINNDRIELKRKTNKIPVIGTVQWIVIANLYMNLF